ncbi:MAG: hypothetical protein M3280_00785 [Actinomycetota bacterium]|nr:hypothetical protein [Actinomycetota bacterium]
MIAQKWLGFGGRVSHRSAAALFGLDGLEQGWIELTTCHKRTSPGGMVIHETRRLHPHDGTTLRGFHVTTPAKTLLDLGSVVNQDTVELALEDALRRKVTTLAALRWQLRTKGGRGIRGSATLRRLLSMRPDGYQPTGSGLEVLLDQLLRTLPVPVYVKQHPVQTRIGTKFLDFAFVNRRVGLEAVSYKWHSGRQASANDIQRDRALQAEGWRIIYVTKEDLEVRRDRFIEDLFLALDRQM